MKTSNKLLIAFALALILIPILGMVYVAQVNYQDAKNGSLSNMQSKLISTPFEAINVADAKRMDLNIRLVKDEKFSVQMEEELAEQISLKVDSTGTLQVSLKDKKGQESVGLMLIIIHAPNIKQISTANTRELTLVGTAESVVLNVKKATSLNFNSETLIDRISLNALDVDEVVAWSSNLKSLSLDLKDTNFRSELSSFDSLSINATGESEIEIKGGDEGYKYTTNKAGKAYTINNLVLNTLGKAEVKLKNIKVNNCSGHFSDETKVQMPAVYLNQMFK